MTTTGPRADIRHDRDSRAKGDRVQRACDTVCIAGMLLLLALGGVLRDWLNAGGPLP